MHISGAAGELTTAMALDVQLLGSGSADRIDFSGMDEEARAVALEKSLAA